MAESRRLLQRARQLIDDNNYQEAQVCCNQILAKDKDNYMALVFLGKTLEESDQARVAFETAIACKPKKSLAWKGLANYHEKYHNAEGARKLLPIYDELLSLDSSNEHALDIIYKVANILIKYRLIDSIKVLLNYMDREPTIKVYVVAKHALLKIIRANIVYNDDTLITIECKLARKILNENLYNSLCIQLAEYLLQRDDLIEAFDEVTQLPYYRSNAVFRNWLCKYLCRFFLADETIGGINIDAYIDDLIEGIEERKYPCLLLSMILYQQGFFIDAYEQCRSLINFHNPNYIEMMYLLKCAFVLKMWVNVELYAKSFFIRATTYETMNNLRKFLFLSYAEQKKFRQAVVIGRDVPLESLDLCDLLTLGKCYIEIQETPHEIMQVLGALSVQYYSQLVAMMFLKEKRYYDILTTLNKNFLEPLNLFQIAEAYWFLKDYDMCKYFLIKAVYYDPEYADAYHLLGVMHEKIFGELQSARFYYEKCLAYNNTVVHYIKVLSDLYYRLGLKRENYALLNSVYTTVEGMSWVNFRIGIYLLENRLWLDAANQFMIAISYDNEEITYFDYLARCYIVGGFPTLALETYRRLMEMLPEKTSYSLCRMAEIHSNLQQYDLAFGLFTQVLSDEPHYPLAVRGMTDTWLRVAQHHFNSGQYNNSRKSAQIAIGYLTAAISSPRHCLEYWKILGNAVIFFSKLPEEFCYVTITFNFNDDLGDLGTLRVKENLYKLAYYCFWRSKSVLSTRLNWVIGRKIATNIIGVEADIDSSEETQTLEIERVTYRQWVHRVLGRWPESPSQWI